METSVYIKKWGNSLGLRLPKAILDEVKLKEGSKLDISTKDGSIYLTPKVPKKYDLSKLLEGINESNLHGETSTGDSKGEEVW
ncbi:AbrB/MazE/SpoVT family DNA-binding domain-containing protein [Prolixibacter sp. SD074]|jgi:antitoxin MazE|uniref:AbrB/MazE/SpoVT family DNA-binding domain-containing protein n=1 Tax=Prolixibacter sp. SD074 TaxID=2652391 RepID=UPI00128988B8|nr:AbrB/MazE/SpoVT family DNA-binding domain-containing protein [Prolixibacter sp. SD074]GET29821.1 multidrug transporter MatE [Prolixibacter sp. SD074]